MICLFRVILIFFISNQVWAAPEIQSWTSENGVPVYFVHLPEIEMIDIELTFDAGSSRDGQSIGIANLVNQMLLEGTTELDVEAFNKQLGLTGATISVDSSKDIATVSMRSLVDAEKFRPAFNLLKDMIGSPRFDSKALDRSKARVAIELQYRSQSPASRSADQFASSLYGNHPYANRTLGDVASIRKILVGDIVSQYETYYVGRNMVIAIVGNVSRKVAEELANGLAHAVPLGVKAKTLPFVEKQTQETIERVEFSSIQSHVRIGSLGVERRHPDYLPLVIGNHALGGNGLVSLLFKRIREERGLAYSAYSYLEPMVGSGAFVAVMQTDRSQEEEALQVMRDTLASVVKNGLSEDDIVAAKANLINGFPLKLDTNAEILNYISIIGFYGLPADYLDTFQDRIAGVTSEQIQRVLREYLKKDRLVSVIVGPAVQVTD